MTEAEVLEFLCFKIVPLLVSLIAILKALSKIDTTLVLLGEKIENLKVQGIDNSNNINDNKRDINSLKISEAELKTQVKDHSNRISSLEKDVKEIKKN